MRLNIAVINGDGVGPEMTEAAVLVLYAVCSKYGHELSVYPVKASGETIDSCNDPLPEESLEQCRQASAVLFGNSGLSKYRQLPLEKRPEYALLKLRKELKVTTNIRPVHLYPSLQQLSPLKEHLLCNGLDYIFVRDIVGGILCSDKVKKRGHHGLEAYELEYYNEKIIADTAKIAFELAEQRNKRVLSLDKSNVLESSRLWRNIITKMGEDFPEISLTHSYIDSAAMNLLVNPGDFDVIVTSNLFGDIISDEGTQLTGTPCLYGSAELARDRKGIYTPNQLHHPDETIIGQQMINPIGMIAAAALMLRYSFGLLQEANSVEAAVEKTLAKGYSTKDIWLPGRKLLSTRKIAEKIISNLL